MLDSLFFSLIFLPKLIHAAAQIAVPVIASVIRLPVYANIKSTLETLCLCGHFLTIHK